MSFSGIYGPSEDAAATALIHDALDAGITMLDSSDAYGKGHNETLLGKAIKGRRAGVVLATKFGNLGGAGGKFADGRPEFVVSSCEASLKRLGVDVIDLYYAHRIDPTVPIEDTVGAMAKLVEQGKVRALGLSEAVAEDDRPRPQGASDRRGAERILAALPRAGRRHAQDHARARHFVRGLCAARPRSAHRRHRRSGDVEPKATPASASRATPATISRTTARWRRRSRPSPSARAARRRSSRWPGCWRRARTSSRFPAPSRRSG